MEQPSPNRSSATANDGIHQLLASFGGDVRLPMPIEAARSAYRTATPFPHVVLDGLFNDVLLDRVLAEASSMRDGRWLSMDQENLERTARMRSAVDMGPAARELVALLHSPGFLYLLSEITDIWQLLPDPYLQGGGHAMMRSGDFFKVHADRNIAYDTGLTRRMAMIVFLNKDWPASYGGALELWDPQGNRCEVAIEPLFNRTAIFEVAFPNYHGVPQPLTCPPDRGRHSFLVYYHTVGVGAGDKVKPHTSRFAPQFYTRRKSLLHRAAMQLTPPIVLTALRKILHPDRAR